MNLLIIIGLAFIYFIVGKASLIFAIPFTNVSPVWPPSGIALTAILLFGYRALPGVFLGSTLMNLSFLNSIHFSGLPNELFTSITIGFGATFQAFLGAYLINTLIKSQDLFSNEKNIIIFFLSAMVSCLINASIGTITLILNEAAPVAGYLNAWWTWWAADTTGIFIITPFILSWIRFPLHQWTLLNIIEAICFILVISILGQIAFFKGYPIEYIFLPILILATVRFKLVGATTTIFLVMGFAVWNTAHSRGPFIRNNVQESLVLLGLFICSIIITTLVLAAWVQRLNNLQRIQEERIQKIKEEIIRKENEWKIKSAELQKYINKTHNKK